MSRLILLATGLVLVLAVGCGSSEDRPADLGSAASYASPTSSAAGSSGTDGVEVVILMKDNYYEPDEVSVPVDAVVEFTVENVGAAIHNMHVLSEEQEGQDFRSDLIVRPGATSVFEATFTQAGTYDFICDYHFPQHVGVIYVE